MKYNNIIGNIILILLIISIVGSVIIAVISCQTIKPENFRYESCYQALLCINVTKGDKVICQNLVNQCTADLEYAKKISTLEYCKSDKRPAFLTEKECFFYLSK